MSLHLSERLRYFLNATRRRAVRSVEHPHVSSLWSSLVFVPNGRERVVFSADRVHRQSALVADQRRNVPVVEQMTFCPKQTRGGSDRRRVDSVLSYGGSGRSPEPGYECRTAGKLMRLPCWRPAKGKLPFALPALNPAGPSGGKIHAACRARPATGSGHTPTSLSASATPPRTRVSS